MPSVSVIVPTYNGAKKISLLLDALLKQTFIDFELVVAVDGSTDDTIEIANKYASRFKGFSVILNENSGRSKIRNSGAQKAQGELLIFYDDDMEPSANSVQMHVDVFRTEPNRIVTGQAIEYVENGKSDLQNYKAVLTSKWVEDFKDSLNYLTFDNLFLTAANLSISRENFKVLNGFDERMTDAEDYDLAYRALEKNIQVLFSKENIAIHRDSITARSYSKRLKEYAKAHRALAQLHPQRKKKPSSDTGFGKRLIYKIFLNGFFLDMIDRNVFAYFLPVKVRYRLYDVIFQAHVLHST